MTKINRIMLTGVAAAALLTLGLASPAFAFHGGGVAECDGCHSMHQSADNPISGAPNSTLLKGSDASSTCLNCHAGNGGYHILSTDGSNENQGGDFYWMTKTYSIAPSWDPTNPVIYEADNHGHNVVAADYALAVDATNATAPGGTYPSASLGCNSCHDPHGQITGTEAISGSGSYGAPAPTDGSVLGNFRLLASPGYIAPGGVALGGTYAAVPVARSTNDPAWGGSYGYITDYGQGMSEFCASCHSGYYGQSQMHPAGNGEKLNGEGANYNSYIATGDFTGDVATAFDGLVPFERAIADSTTLSVDPVTGTDTSSNVMCLTCHRAHASANENAGKWDFSVELIEETVALQAQALGQVDANAAIYYKGGTNGMTTNDVIGEYGEWQRSLCNKCHAKD